MQATVPQFIDVEDRIIGPLTLKQFLYFVTAGALELVYWFFFDFSLFILVSIPTLAIAAAFAFFKINDRPFIYFVLAVIGYYFKPVVRVWHRRGSKLTARDIIAVSFLEEEEGAGPKKDLLKAHMKRGQLDHIERALETA